MIQDALRVKEKIIQIIKRRGPSLPAHIAKETELSILFSSAFLSELFSERKIRISAMKVGSSPLYFLPGQEPFLENFAHHLKSKEKEAFLLIKEKKFLFDKEQIPAIRVALREIRDFAIPLKNSEGELVWRYFTVPKEEMPDFKKQEKEAEKKEQVTTKIKEPEKIIVKSEKKENVEKKEELGIFEETPKKTDKKGKPEQKKKTKKESKTNDKFFDRIKEFLAEKSVEILDIESFSRNEIILKVRENNQEKFLISYNKKRLSDEDIIKANKKSLQNGLKYRILSFGEPLKKTQNLIDALKNLEKMEKIE